VAFHYERDALVRWIGALGPGDPVERMLESRWDAIVRFAELAMTVKEAAERQRQAIGVITPSRRRGRRRR